MKPLIGITIGYQEGNATMLAQRDCYGKGIIMAGGNPILLPPQGDPEETASLIAGLLLSGGPDPDPQHFHEQPRPGMGRVDWRRDCHELALIRAMRSRKKPIFGICRGLQMINIAYGGTLFQDIEKEKGNAVSHFQNGDFDYESHWVRITPGSLLDQLYQRETLAANSFHHQAVKFLGKELHIAAVAADGIIEAIEGENGVFAVQWHPEHLLHIPAHFLLFQHFIKTCSERKTAL